MEPSERIDAEAVMAHLDWVQGLARSLVADPGLADDISQETWLVALRQPPSTTGSLRAWLGRVVRSAALQEHRRASVRRDYEERSAEPRASSSPPELLEKVAVQRSVVDGVLALREPYRSALILRYFEGLSPQGIARSTDTPVATVKTRLARGLGMLRERLDREYGGDGEAWLRAVAPLAFGGAWKSAVVGGAWMAAMKVVLGGAAAVLLLVVVSRWMAEPVQPGAPDAPLAEAAPLADGEQGEPPIESGSSAVGKVRTALRSSSSPPEGSLRVVVVQAGTGDRLQGAEIWYGSYEPFNAHRDARRRHENPDLEELLQAMGTRAISDGSGEWLAPDGNEARVFCARAGDRWGWSLRPKGDELVLELTPDRTLTVDVVGEDGLPREGVGIQLGTTRPELSDRLGDYWSGPDGRLELRHLDAFYPDLREGSSLCVSLSVPLRTPVEWTGDPARLPRQPIRLVLPETGSLRVHVSPWREVEARRAIPAWVNVTPLLRDPVHPESTLRGRRQSIRLEGGEAQFAYVGLGLELLVEVHPDQHMMPPEPRRVRGPQRSGEEVACGFELRGAYPVITGSLFAPDGAPLEDAGVEGEVVVESDGRTERVEFRTRVHSAGGLAVTLPTRAREEDFRRLRLTTESVPRLTADVAIQLPNEQLSGHVGEIRLERPPIVASGRVVHSDGEPFHWAAVRVVRKVPWNNADGYQWHNANEYMTMSGPDGAFEVVGELGEGEFAIFATASGYLDAPRQVLSGSNTDLVLTLEQEGQLAGSVRLDEGIDPTWLRVTARPKLESARFSFDPDPEYVPTARLLSNGSFLLSNLPPGPARVTLAIEGQPSPLAVVDDVPVVSGEVVRDPRLQGLDLRGELRRIEIGVRNLSGDPIAQGHVAFDLGADGVRHIALEGGRASILTQLAALDVEVFAPGYQTERRSGVNESIDVQLLQGIPVRIRLAPELELPDSGLELRVGLLPAPYRRRAYGERVFSADGERRLQWIQWESAQMPVLGPERSALVHATEAGVQRVIWTLYRPTNDPLESSWSYTFSTSQELTVEHALDVELAPDPEDYARAIQQASE